MIPYLVRPCTHDDVLTTINQLVEAVNRLLDGEPVTRVPAAPSPAGFPSSKEDA